MIPTSTQLDALYDADPRLGAVVGRVPPFPGFPVGEVAEGTHFHALTRSIVFQQLATPAARSIWNRVRALGAADGPPDPDTILSLPEETLRGAGLSRSKAKAIRSLATHVTEASVDLDRVSDLPDPEVVEVLTQVWGIGEWTAHMFLIFRLGRLDVMPTGDLGVREGARILDGLDERPSAGELAERARVWAPLRSVAAWVLWRLTDEGVA